MQSSGLTSENDLHASAVSPPPPPPLPPPVSSKFIPSPQNCGCKYLYNNKSKPSKKSPQEEVTSALRHITYNFYAENPSNLVSLYYPVSAIIQEGRCCGLVALSMASQLIYNVPVESIFNEAKSMNFTKEGEMFSALNMSILAESLLNCDATVLDNLDDNRDAFLNHICDGWPLLIPYDADRNHFPCSNNGLTAHWAIITGLCFTVSDKNALISLKKHEVIQEYPELKVFVVKDSMIVKNLLKYSEKIFLYAHQGKSKHLAAWDLNDLVESNKNMYEVTKKYSSDELILPSGDFLSELRNKAVLLKKRGLENN